MGQIQIKFVFILDTNVIMTKNRNIFHVKKIMILVEICKIVLYLFVIETGQIGA